MVDPCLYGRPLIKTELKELPPILIDIESMVWNIVKPSAGAVKSFCYEHDALPISADTFYVKETQSSWLWSIQLMHFVEDFGFSWFSKNQIRYSLIFETPA